MCILSIHNYTILYYRLYIYILYIIILYIYILYYSTWGPSEVDSFAAQVRVAFDDAVDEIDPDFGIAGEGTPSEQWISEERSQSDQWKKRCAQQWG